MEWLIGIVAVGSILGGAFVVGMGTGDTSGFEGKRALVGRAVNHWIVGRRFPQPMYQLTTVAGRKMRRTERGAASAISVGEHATTRYSWTPEQRATEVAGRLCVTGGIFALAVEIVIAPVLAILAIIAVFSFHLAYYQVRRPGITSHLAAPALTAVQHGKETVQLEPTGPARDRYDG